MEKERDSDTLKIIEKFEQMIQENKSFYLDLNELEEIIIYYFHEANYDMAEKAIDLANEIFPKSINISILSSEILLQKSKESEAFDLINDCLDLNSENYDLIFQKAKILNKLKKYSDSNNLLFELSDAKETIFLVDDLMLRNYMNLDQYTKSIKVAKKLIYQFPIDKKRFVPIFHQVFIFNREKTLTQTTPIIIKNKDDGLFKKNSVKFPKKLKLLFVSIGNIFGSEPIINPIRIINVCFLKLINKYLIILENTITPIANPNPNVTIVIIEFISTEKFDIFFIKNSYVPSIIKM